MTLKQYILKASLGFCLASLVVFATVAFAERWMYEHLSVFGAYLIWTILFIGLGGAVLRPLVKSSVSAAKFYAIFGVAFFLYAVGWVVPYFTLRGAVGEWIGSLAGSVLLGLSFAVGFGALRLAPRLCIALFAANSVGYFLGSVLNTSIGGQVGMLFWGVSYGLFLGLGLGVSLYLLEKMEQPSLKTETV